MDCSTPGFSVLHYLLEFAQIHVHWVHDAISPSHPVLPSSPSASSLFCIRIFSNELDFCIRWPKCWSFSISLFNEYSGLISFRIDWFDLLAVQRLSRVFSSTTIQKHQFFGAQPSLWSCGILSSHKKETKFCYMTNLKDTAYPKSKKSEWSHLYEISRTGNL